MMENIALFELLFWVFLVIGLILLVFAGVTFVHCQQKGYISFLKKKGVKKEVQVALSDEVEELTSAQKLPAKEKDEEKMENPPIVVSVNSQEGSEPEPEAQEDMTGILNDDSLPTEALEDGAEETTKLEKEHAGNLKDNALWAQPSQDAQLTTLHKIVMFGSTESDAEGEKNE